MTNSFNPIAPQARQAAMAIGSIPLSSTTKSATLGLKATN